MRCHMELLRGLEQNMRDLGMKEQLEEAHMMQPRHTS